MKPLLRQIGPFLGTLRDMLPILLTIAAFEGAVQGRIPPDSPGLVLGFMAVLVGLTLMVRGLEMSLFPIGEALADAMARRGHPAWLLGFAFALGFGSTVAFFLVLGSTLTLLGAFGLFHLKSFYDRIHAPTLGTSWGTAAILLASLLAWSWVQDRVFVHELVIGICVMVTTPVTLMFLGRAALHRDRVAGTGAVPGSSSAPVQEPSASDTD